VGKKTRAQRERQAYRDAGLPAPQPIKFQGVEIRLDDPRHPITGKRHPGRGMKAPSIRRKGGRGG
jgi:hypothetical protein